MGQEDFWSGSPATLFPSPLNLGENPQHPVKEASGTIRFSNQDSAEEMASMVTAKSSSRGDRYSSFENKIWRDRRLSELARAGNRRMDEYFLESPKF